MSIRIEITGDTPQAIAESVLSMAFMIAPRLREQSAAPAAETAEVVEPERKPRRASRKTETVIEHDEKEVADDVRRDTGKPGVGDNGGAGAASATGDASSEVASGTDAAGAGGSTGEDASNKTATEMAAMAAPDKAPSSSDPEMTIDELRKFTINEYLNVVTDKLDERKNLYKALLDQFQVEAINALAPDQINAFKAAVEARIAEAVKA